MMQFLSNQGPWAFMYLYTRIACNCRSISSREAVKKHFLGHYIQSWRKFQDFQELAPGLKYFSRKNRIQGLFKDFPLNSRTFQDCANPVFCTDLHFRVNSIKIFTRLPPRAKSWEFPAAAIKINPGYFHRVLNKSRHPAIDRHLLYKLVAGYFAFFLLLFSFLFVFKSSAYPFHLILSFPCHILCKIIKTIETK